MAPRHWIALATLLLAACSSPEERLAEHLERGESYLAEGRTEEALLEFQSALNLRPDDAALFERVGQVLYERNQFDEALRYFSQAHQLDPSLMEAAMMEARLLVLRNPTRARQIVRRALREAPERDIVYRTQAHLRLARGDTRSALIAAERATELGPDDPENWAQLGAVHEMRINQRKSRRRRPTDGDYEAALAAFERVSELEPGDPRGLVLQARVMAGWPGHQMEAYATFERALEMALASGAAGDVALVAHTLDEYGRELEAPRIRRRALRALVDLEPRDFESWEALARLTGGREPLRAEVVYLELLEKEPKAAQAHLLYANYLIRTDRAPDAAAHIRHVLDDGVDAAGLWSWLVRLEIQHGRLARARAAYVEMEERHPDLPITRTAKARLTLAEGRAAEATRLITTLLAAGENFELQRLKALAEYRLGNLRDARVAIDRAMALSTSPHYPTIRLRARIHHDMRSWHETVKMFRLLRGRGQELSAEEKVLLATALHHGGKRVTAREMLEELVNATPPHPGAAVAYAELEGRRQPKRARELLLRSFEQRPAHPDVLELLTSEDVKQGRVQEALDRLTTVVAGGRAAPRTLRLRAELLAGVGAYDEAEADLLRAFEADPLLPGAMDLLYSIYAAQDRIEEARRSFEQAEQAGVLHAGARMLLARLYLVEGNHPRARETYEQVLAENPTIWSAKNDLAWVLAEEGEDLDRALQLARDAHVASGQTAATADTVGYVHLKAGRYESGLQQFRKAVRIARRAREPAQTYQYHSGLALEGLGRAAEATRAFRRALAEGDFPEADDARRRLEGDTHSGSGTATPG
ncbi:MAG: tetratricopeptide repeat protein [Myxococcota bacterium]|nr:tetratricopeptide repeat protein [Myxococcota bacterium]